MASSLMCKVTILSHDAYVLCSSFVYNVIVVLPPPRTKSDLFMSDLSGFERFTDRIAY